MRGWRDGKRKPGGIAVALEAKGGSEEGSRAVEGEGRVGGEGEGGVVIEDGIGLDWRGERRVWWWSWGEWDWRLVALEREC